MKSKAMNKSRMIGEMIADHDRDRQSRDFQNMIVSDRRSRKKVSCLTLAPA